MRISTLLLAFVLVSNTTLAGYTTPNTGVRWNLDSLVTHSGGILSGAFPNYSLSDTVTVSAGDRLTIEAGSVITVSQGAGKGFTVFGVLQAIGTVTDSIIVKGSVDSAGWHRGFRFDDTSVDSLCVVSYCRIMNAVDAVYCFNSNMTVTNCLFTKNSSNGVRCYGASPVVRNCLFTFNKQAAITANVNSSPLIEGNVFSYNNYQNTSAYNAIAIGGQGTNNPIIRRNEIYNRDYYRSGAIGLSTLTSSDICNALIENNSLHDNAFGVATTAFSAGGTIKPVIRYNRIENNRLNPNALVSGSGITMYYGGATNAPTITGNYIKGNYWGITIVASTGLANSPQPNIGNLGNADTTDDGWNIFINNNNNGSIYQLYNNGTQNILAENNYWGSSDSATIERWIVHQPDSAVFGFVQYRPWGTAGFGHPSSFTVQQVSDSTVKVMWHYQSTSIEGGVRVLTGNDSLSLSLAAQLGVSETSYVVRAPFGVRRYYGLSSYNRFGEGDTSIRTFRISDITPPAVPTGFLVSSSSFPLKFRLTWNRNMEQDLQAYRIYRSRRDTSQRAFLAQVVRPDTLFVDSTVVCDTLYHYWLTAIDTASNESRGTQQQHVHSCPLSVDDQPEIPAEFSLAQNYPNPFNPETIIRFSIKAPGIAELKLFDVLGREVRTLLHEERSPGSYELRFDARELSSGVYYYRLVSGSYRATRKMVVVR